VNGDQSAQRYKPLDGSSGKAHSFYKIPYVYNSATPMSIILSTAAQLYKIAFEKAYNK